MPDYLVLYWNGSDYRSELFNYWDSCKTFYTMLYKNELPFRVYKIRKDDTLFCFRKAGEME